MSPSDDPPRGLLPRALALVERAGNALPHPATLFALLAVGVVGLSALGAALGWAVRHPATGEAVAVVNLGSVAGLHRMLTEAVTNFTGFAPLGTVLVALLGIAVAESSGLIAAALRLVVLGAPRRLVTSVVVFAGVMSNLGGDVGYVLFLPLSGMVFAAMGRPALAGLAAAFAGVSGGFSANLLLGPLDPLLAGLSQEAAQIVQPGYTVSAAANWYFMIASTALVTGLGAWVTERWVEPRLRAPGDAVPATPPPGRLSDAEKRGLVWATAATLALTAVILAGLLPADGFLRDPRTGSVLTSPFLSGVVTVIFVGGTVAGLAYGLGAGTIRSDDDVVKGMSRAMETMAVYIVLVFFAAQFVAYFRWSNLGLVTAITGAEALRSLGLGPVPLMLGFILLTSLVNLVLGSASAKWSVMAPVFVPMFMLLGLSPELTQTAYRIGDSSTNIVTPLMNYFPVVLAFAQRHQPKLGLGTLIATMLPYSLVFLVGWSLLLVVWLVFRLPLGPGAPMFLPVP